MKRLATALAALCILLASAPGFAKDTTKSPDKNKDVTYDCSLSGKTMTCTLTLNNAGKKTLLQNMKFPYVKTGGEYSTETVHYCKSVWAPDSKKLVYYCYYQTNVSDENLFPDENVFLYLFDLSTGKKLELKKGGLKSNWTLGTIPNPKTCQKDTVSWALNPQDTFIKFDGNNITYHVVRYSNGEEDYDNYCKQVKCQPSKDMQECSGPISTKLNVITQNTNGKIVSKKDICYYYIVCD